MCLGCVFGGGCVWRESLRAKLQERTLMLIYFVVCGWVLQWDRGGRSRLGAREPALLNRAAGGWMVKPKVFLSSGVGSINCVEC